MAVKRNPESAEALAFREIARRGEIATGALSRILGVTPRALHRAIRDLEGRRLVQPSSNSRRIAINPDFGHVVGIDMGASNLRFALADLRGDIQAHTARKLRPEDGPRRMIAQIKEGIRRLAASASTGEEPHADAGRASPAPARGERASRLHQEPKPAHGRLQALAICVPSAVDPRTGLVAFANNLPGWRNIDLRRALAKEFRIPVYLENDANMAAIGEHWRGVARDVQHFVFLAFGTGIGSGIFTNGRLYSGRTGNAGELFRLHLEWPRWAEDFGDLGYFESQVSGIGIAAAGRAALAAAVAAPGRNLAAERDARFVFEASRLGNPAARAVLDKAFTMMGVAVADLVTVLDPDLIVFGGGVSTGAPELLLETVNRVVRHIHPDPPPVRLSALQDQAQIHGAIFSALRLAEDAVARRL